METLRLERLLRILAALQTGRSYTANALADLARTTRRTLFRDLGVLKRAGIAFSYDRASKRYFMQASVLKSPNCLTTDEVLVLLTALRFASGHPLNIDPETYTSALTKFESLVPRDAQVDCSPLLEALSFRHDPGGDGTAIRDIFLLIRSAIVNRLMIRVAIDHGAGKDFVLEPHQLCFGRGAWHVFGREQVTGDVRALKLARLRRVDVLERSVKMQKQHVGHFLGLAWHLHPEGKAYRVRIRFIDNAALEVDETHWHQTQCTTWLDQRTLLFEANVDGLSEIARWVLGFGDEVEVLEPLALRELVNRRARALYTNHASIARTRKGAAQSIV